MNDLCRGDVGKGWGWGSPHKELCVGGGFSLAGIPKQSLSLFNSRFSISQNYWRYTIYFLKTTLRINNSALLLGFPPGIFALFKKILIKVVGPNGRI